MITRAILVVAGCCLVAVVALAVPQPTLVRGVFGGGGMAMGPPAAHITGTVGQGVVARHSGSSGGSVITLQSGYWHPATAVSPVPEPGGALQPGLRGNHPNPFNPMTVVRYEVGDHAAAARLRVFDPAGRLVKTLIDEVVAPGEQKVTWRGFDDHGNRVASGVYFALLEVDGARFTRKMTLLK